MKKQKNSFLFSCFFTLIFLPSSIWSWNQIDELKSPEVEQIDKWFNNKNTEFKITNTTNGYFIPAALGDPMHYF